MCENNLFIECDLLLSVWSSFLKLQMATDGMLTCCRLNMHFRVSCVINAPFEGRQFILLCLCLLQMSEISKMSKWPLEWLYNCKFDLAAVNRLESNTTVHTPVLFQ